MKYWVWVFGVIEGLRWILDHKRMAFPEHATTKIETMRKGDRAVLYVTRGAHHNPGRDEAHLAGLATVTAIPRPEDPPVEIAGRDFPWSARIRLDHALPERDGPLVRVLAPKLEVVRKPEHWGNYFRQSPVEISEDDFAVLQDALEAFANSELS